MNEGGTGDSWRLPSTAPSIPRPPAAHPGGAGALITRMHRLVLALSATIVGALAALLPMIGSQVKPMQACAAVGAAWAFAWAPYFRPTLPIALGLVAFNTAVALPGSRFPLLTIAPSAIFALAASEGLALAAMWRTDVPLTSAAERPHVRAIGVRVALGATASGAVMLLGGAELPSPTVAVGIGALAAAALIWLVTTRPAD